MQWAASANYAIIGAAPCCVCQLQKQIGGSHYKDNFKIQPIEYIQANRMLFEEGCVVKYVSRHSFKNGKEDILKAIQNLEFILERDYND